MAPVYTEMRICAGRTLWLSRGEAPGAVPADGCVDLIVRYGAVLVCGPQTRWLRPGAAGPEGLLGVRLAPGSAHALLGGSLAELRDRLVPLQEAAGKGRTEARALREALLGAQEALGRGQPSHPARKPQEAQVWLRHLACALAPATAPTWTAVVRRAAWAGIPATRAAACLDWSERTLRRRMQTEFGYGYTTLVRVYRAQQVLRLLADGVPPAEAAARAGYCDQPHLTRQLHELAGTTPAQLALKGA